MTVHDLVTGVHEELEDGQTVITPYQFGLLFIDWTDPQKLAKL
jgi:condensin complex subunit 3